MKKLTFLLGGVLLFVGCSTKQEVKKEPAKNVCQIENQPAPEWICMPEDTNEYIVAVGSAEKSSLGFSFARTAAVEDARDALARRIETQVKSEFRRYEAQTGVKNPQNERVLENISKHTTKVVLRGVKTLKLWQTKNSVYVLVGVPKSAIESAKSSIKKLAEKKFNEL